VTIFNTGTSVDSRFIGLNPGTKNLSSQENVPNKERHELTANGN
jgi:hypothetical protein